MKEERIYLADKVVSRSRNLRGIRRYCGKHIVESVWVDRGPTNGSGILSIYFANGASFKTLFASFDCLKETVKNWRNLRGSKITIEA